MPAGAHRYRATSSKTLLFPYQILYQALYLGSLFKPRSQAGQTLPTFLPGDQPGSTPRLIPQLASPLP